MQYKSYVTSIIPFDASSSLLKLIVENDLNFISPSNSLIAVDRSSILTAPMNNGMSFYSSHFNQLSIISLCINESVTLCFYLLIHGIFVCRTLNSVCICI